jgi:hypothetical protein
MNKLVTTALAMAFGCLATTSASALPVQITETGLANGQWTNSLSLPVQSGTANYWAGLQTIVVDNAKSFLAFCVDPWEWSPSSNQGYSTNSLSGVFGTTKANYIRELYSQSYDSTLKNNNGGANAAAAFQLALWEIIADGDLHLDGTGLVRSNKDTTQNLVAEANAMLNQIDGHYGKDNYDFTFYTSGKSAGVGNTAGFQDYLVANKIPEPGMMLLMATALSAAGLVSLRRRKATTQN